MDQSSILDHSSAPPAVREGVPGLSTSRSAAASVSAGIAAANLLLTLSSEKTPRFPGEDGGRSLADMAHGDLDATLQLLADRAQFITGASGAAIALRRGEHTDMLCRASAGSNAPELGALLSMEYGLSGESVRTGRALRCDDAENDPRVNREGCRELGIASVVVMPIVSDEQVLGVFELFSGKVHAFDERDLSALQRLGEMVETAVRYAVAAQGVTVVTDSALGEDQPPGSRARTMISESVPVAVVKQVPVPREERAEAALKKPLLWSAAIRTQGSAGQAKEKEVTESIAVPAVLRKLQKCQACGFPVSQGRTFCVECEEKQWRGQRLSQAAAAGANQGPREQVHAAPDAPVAVASTSSSSVETYSVRTSEKASVQTSTHAGVADNTLADLATVPAIAGPAAAASATDAPADVPSSNDSALFLSSALQSRSWFSANKYIFGALLLMSIVIGAIAWLR